MASATKEVTDVSYVLKLSEAEAEALRTTLGRIGGENQYGTRIHLTKVYKALSEAGVVDRNGIFVAGLMLCAWAMNTTTPASNTPRNVMGS